ncbi:aminodeoxychorismate/anthranilate synthase component II [Erythrobacteraceae bacterium CFH 75059]|uniref:anthranilate synthase component II n=1 Tax=Qipengyuania thermophila TaxID=2509361 RepID=UPI0010220458|nr:aminodeoxychorismate/anthranilate synthase component II [Qipengyuania thermophila]TCD05275.1 aminodeoxychorismate/anthranilate synthase component II [Erythrobacteraceae bacterium CFH 75059]
MILVIDNYDSFTFNLIHYLQELGAAVEVARNDALTAAQALGSGAAGILISPGPGTPDDAGITLDVVAACAQESRPLLGVCLGHQAIGQAFGGTVVRGALMHGKTSAIAHDGTGLFAGLPNGFTATRYHSLVVDAVPDELVVNATSTTPGLPGEAVMGLRHRTLPIHGVQFHPESIASEHGHQLLANFLALCGEQPCGVSG